MTKAASCMSISTSIEQQLQDDPPATTSSSGSKEPWTFIKKNYTAFDDVPADIVDLSMGAPGEALLKKSKEIMKKATVHKMVRPSQ